MNLFSGVIALPTKLQACSIYPCLCFCIFGFAIIRVSAIGKKALAYICLCFPKGFVPSRIISMISSSRYVQKVFWESYLNYDIKLSFLHWTYEFPSGLRRACDLQDCSQETHSCKQISKLILMQRIRHRALRVS